MDMRAERTGRHEARESYTMLIETDAFLRHNRALRRELCIIRAITVILLTGCMAFCAVRYLQHAAGGQNDIMNQEKVKETIATLQANEQKPDEEETREPLTAFLQIVPNFSLTSARANLTWRLYPESLCFKFLMSDVGDYLVIPRGGWYRLGLQVTYAGTTDESRMEPIYLTHNITKYSGMYQWKPQTILSVYETVHEKGKWFKSVFSEVVQVFGKKDKVTVQSNNALLVDSSGETTTKTFLTVQLISAIEDLD